MNKKTYIFYLVLSISSFHLAYISPICAPIIIFYLFSLYKLSHMDSARITFYTGIIIGLAVISPHLFFFYSIFGTAALLLWLILAIWQAIFMLTTQQILKRKIKFGHYIIPLLWTGLEFFRSEMYYLKFSWLSPGFAFNHSVYSSLLVFGSYGISLIIFYLIIFYDKRQWRLLAFTTSIIISLMLLSQLTSTKNLKQGPKTLILQYEYPYEEAVIAAFEKLVSSNKDIELIVMSEYSFDGPIPQSVIKWIDDHNLYLIAGGKEELESTVSNSRTISSNKMDLYSAEKQFKNTIFVIGPEGTILHRQVKSVPIQFFSDGLAAEKQALWESPWGKIGLAVCYDLSYSKVIDNLVDYGAEALIIPTMDAEEWGEHEHWLHAKVGPVRAAEYKTPILRVASSGISQHINSQAAVFQKTTFPGQGEYFIADLELEQSRKPLDRYFITILAWFAISFTLGFFLFAVKNWIFEHILHKIRQKHYRKPEGKVISGNA